MARRRIGQERLNVHVGQSPHGASLNEISVLIDWAEIDRALAGIYAAAKGEPGWPPLALFKALLLATWHDLSDVKLAKRSMIGPASAGSAGSPPVRRRLSAPPSSGSAPSWYDAAWIGHCVTQSHGSSTARVSRCGPERWWTRP